MAVIGSVDMVKIGNRVTRGRSYEWGTVSVENESHCDFLKFREMLLSTNMLDLIEVTHAKHYQRYRAHRLREIGFDDDDNDKAEMNTEVDGNLQQQQQQHGGSQLIHDVYRTKRDKLSAEIAEQEARVQADIMRRVKDKEIELRDMEKEVCSKIFFFRLLLYMNSSKNLVRQ